MVDAAADTAGMSTRSSPPRLHERGAVPRDVGEMPVKAAFGHSQ